MLVRLSCEHLETRDNPSGPEIIDPIGIPTTVASPTNVPGQTAPTPAATTTATPIDIAIQQIIDTTLAAINHGW